MTEAIERELKPRIWEHQTMQEVKERVLFEALEHNSWNRTYAAEDLGISVRTVRKMIERIRNKGIAIPENMPGRIERLRDEAV